MQRFSKNLEDACIEAVEGGVMTKDLSLLAFGRVEGAKRENYALTDEFIDAVADRIRAKQEL